MHLTAPPAQGQSADRSTLLGIVLYAVMTLLVLGLPTHPDALSPWAFLRMPIEGLVLAAALLSLGGALFQILRFVGTALLVAILFLKLADLGTNAAFQRVFNPYLDGKMMIDGWRLLSGTIGVVPAGLSIAAVLLVFAGVAVAYFWSLGRLQSLPHAARHRVRIATFALVAVCTFGLIFERATGLDLRIDATVPGYVQGRATLIARSVADMRDFDRLLAEKAREPALTTARFGRVRGKDVVLIFIESYGRSAIEDPLYAPRIVPRLGAVEEQIEAAGLHAASRWLGSPTVGGLSWLAHGTFLSGLWINNQARYDRLIDSTAPSLNSLFRQSGWQTVAAMPAISMDWPESRYFGYDRILDAKGLGYRGKPFNWVTMPDQYTLSAFERLARPKGHRPVMAEIALISSHAPWTPIPHLIDWDAVGDGTIFNAQAENGDPPSVVWSDPKRIRAQYLLSVDYALETLGSYMARFGKDTVFILLGDHQPAAVITGPDASRAVPVHIVTADPSMTADLQSNGWTAGMLPDRSGTVLPMDRMRGTLIDLLDAKRGLLLDINPHRIDSLW